MLTLTRYHAAQPDSLCRYTFSDGHGRRCGSGWLSKAAVELGLSGAAVAEATRVVESVVSARYPAYSHPGIPYVNDFCCAWKGGRCAGAGPLLAVLDEAADLLR